MDVSYTIDDAAELVYRNFDNPAIEPAVKEWALDQLQEYQRKIDYVIHGDTGYEDFLLTYVQREVDRYDVDADDLPDGVEPREKPLCTCADVGCHLKRGQLPQRIRSAQRLEQGLLRSRQEHPGEPVVLSDALDEWSEMHGEVFGLIRNVVIYMTEDREEPPTAGGEGQAAEADGD